MDQRIETQSFNIGNPPFYLEAVISLVGNDLCIFIGGGQKFHLGAVAVAYPYQKYNQPGKISSSVSLITIPGHKEDQLVLQGAGRLSKIFKCSVVLSAGLHIDNATDNDINHLSENFSHLLMKIEEFLKTNLQKNS